MKRTEDWVLWWRTIAFIFLFLCWRNSFYYFPWWKKSYYLKKQSWFLQVYLMQQFLIYSWVQGRPSYDLKNNWVILLFYPYCHIPTPLSPKFSYFWTFYILFVGLGEVIHCFLVQKKNWPVSIWKKRKHQEASTGNEATFHEE